MLTPSTMLSPKSNIDVSEPVKVSPSRIGVFQECPKLYDFVYNKQLKIKGSSSYMDQGLYIHELLHVYYQTLRSNPNMPRPALAGMIKHRIAGDVSRNVTPANAKIFNTALKLVERFILQQSKKIDHGIKVLDIEYEYEIPVTTPSGRVVHLYGFIDLVYKTLRGQPVVRDHKSTGNSRSFSQRMTEADNQLLNYGLAYFLKTGDAPRVEFNVINTYDYKSKPDLDQVFQLYSVTHTDKVYENFLAETLQLIDEMLDSKPTPHYSRSCSSCSFWDPCSMARKGASVDNLLKANYESRTYEHTRSYTASSNNTESNSTPKESGSNFS